MVALIARPVFIFNTLLLLLLGATGIRADESRCAKECNRFL